MKDVSILYRRFLLHNIGTTIPEVYIMQEMLSVKQVEKYYGNKGSLTRALNGISFTIYPGEFVGIMGASGSGKTTLLNCIATVDKVTTGSILLEGSDITKMNSNELAAFRRDRLGFIFQDYNLLDTLTGEENMLLPLTLAGKSAKSARLRVQEVAVLLRIQPILNKFPYEMSGGEQQRVAAGRALLNKPSLILADEPTGSLDSGSSRQLLETLSQMNRDEKSTIMMVTHDGYASSYCQRILFIKDGRLFQELLRGDLSKNEFFEKILAVTSLMGGEQYHAV